MQTHNITPLPSCFSEPLSAGRMVSLGKLDSVLVRETEMGLLSHAWRLMIGISAGAWFCENGITLLILRVCVCVLGGVCTRMHACTRARMRARARLRVCMCVCACVHVPGSQRGSMGASACASV
jgi:hypothetical protein